MRKMLLTMIAVMLMAAPLNVFAENDVTVMLDGNVIEFPDAQPLIDENSRTLVPIRFVSEAMGAEVSWEQESREVTIVKGKDTIVYEIGSLGAFLNNQSLTFDTRGVLKESRTFVPLRFVAEMLYCDVQWADETRTVEITSPPEPVAFPEPKVTVNFPDSPDSGRLFWITIDSIRDYADCDNYQFKIEFANPVEFNTIEQRTNEIVGWETFSLNQWKKVSFPSSRVFSISSAYYTTRENMGTFKLYDGMPMEFILSVQRLCSGEIREYAFSEAFQYKYPE